MHTRKKTKTDERGFALATTILLALMISVGLAGLFQLTKGLSKTIGTYGTASSLQEAHRTGAKLAAEVIQTVMVDNEYPTASLIQDGNLFQNDLMPSDDADFTDDVMNTPDLEATIGRWRTRIDIDYMPLTSGFSWTEIRFGMGYQSAAAGGSSKPSQTYRVHIVTTGDGTERKETEAVYVLRP